MNTLAEAALNELETLLATAKNGAVEPSRIAERVRPVLDLLSDAPWWIGTDQARLLLGVESDATVAAWTRLGLLRNRTRPDGGIELLLEDVLHHRLERDELVAVGGDELSPEDLKMHGDERPGQVPWERKSPTKARAGR